MRAPVVLAGSLAIALLSVSAFAQIPPASIADEELGWVKIYEFKPATEPLTLDHRVYSPAQRTIARDLANWMQASYRPIGGLGNVVVGVNEKLTPYNQNTAAAAQRYGAVGSIYTELKRDASGTLGLFSRSHVTWNVVVNGSFGEHADTLSTPDREYFTIPTFAQQGYADDLEKAVDLASHPFLGRFPAWFQRNSFNGNRKFLLLSKDGRLPFVKLTRAEYLDAIAVAITRAYDIDRKRIAEAEQGNQEPIARSMQPIEERTATRRAVLEANRANYKGRLHEVAEIWKTQPDIMLENFPDVFEGNGGSSMRLPVYTVDAATLERCKSDAPQWVVVSWTAMLNDPVSKHLHDAILTQFNLEYIYDRFFDPEKVKGQPYSPRRPARAETATAEASALSKKVAADPNVYFFDDFSTTPAGRRPINWRSTLDSAGASSVVVELQGLEGHWAALSGFTVSPARLEGPLPRDFTVAYELVAARGYTWGARGMTFMLSKGVAQSGKESFFSVRLRPGFGTRDGEAVVEGKFPGAPGSFNDTQWLPVPGFSNTAQNNRITVTIEKQGEMVRLFIGGAKIAEYPRAIPDALVFDAVSFDLERKAGPNDQMFISNVRITKP
jgi:hypothetical protein